MSIHVSISLWAIQTLVVRVWSRSVGKVSAIYVYHGNVYEGCGSPEKTEKSLTAYCCIYAHFVTLGKHLERWVAEIKLKVSCCSVVCSKRTVCHLLLFDQLMWKKRDPPVGFFYCIFTVGSWQFICKPKNDVTAQWRGPPTSFTAKPKI